MHLIIPSFYQKSIIMEGEVKPMPGFSRICPIQNNLYVSMVINLILSITCGIPQGSFIGPRLFLLYINDLPNTSKLRSFQLFADDTNIHCSSNDPILN